MQYLDDGLKGWIHKTARNNLWKVGTWYDLDDLIQEGYLVYCKCLKRFEEADHLPENEKRKRFMAYFKSAYENHLRDLAQEKTPEMSFAALTSDTEQEVQSVFDIPQPEEVSLYMALLQAPTEVLEVFQALIQDAQEAGSYLRSRLRRKLNDTGG